MKKKVILSGVMVSVLLTGTMVCQAAKWDKNSFKGKGIEAGFYDVDSIKVKGKLTKWTEKYVFAPDGIKHFTGTLSQNTECKQNIEELGDVTQFQVDYQVKNGKYRGTGKRYYNKSNKLICANSDLGNEFDTKWHEILRGSPIEDAIYELVTKYKVNVPQ